MSKLDKIFLLGFSLFLMAPTPMFSLHPCSSSIWNRSRFWKSWGTFASYCSLFFLFKSLGIGLAHVKENNNKQKCENILLKYLVVFCQIVLIFFFFVLISVGFSHIFLLDWKFCTNEKWRNMICYLKCGLHFLTNFVQDLSKLIFGFVIAWNVLLSISFWFLFLVFGFMWDWIWCGWMIGTFLLIDCIGLWLYYKSCCLSSK